MNVDILAFGAHPDDIELSCAGTLLKHITLGYSVALVDLTRGELGTRGNADTRLKEARAAADSMKIEHRRNLGLKDCFFEINEASLMEVIKVIRFYKPRIVFANAKTDRHPDHGRGGDLVSRACFLSGLIKIKSEWNSEPQGVWRPSTVLHYIQDRYIEPDIIVDISPYYEKKMQAVFTFRTQFYDPNSHEPETALSGSDYPEHLKGRAFNYGRLIGTRFAEGFTTERPPGIEDLLTLK